MPFNRTDLKYAIVNLIIIHVEYISSKRQFDTRIYVNPTIY